MRISKIKLHADRAPQAQHSNTQHRAWRLGVLTSAVALLGGLVCNPAYALGLGRITVQSALGEALRAEIDVPEISADEAASLRVNVAPPDAFKAAGLEYTAAVVGVQVSLQKRPDGRSFLRLTSTRPVTEPFVDLILEANWAAGKVVRDYTMLFDPPSLRQAAAPTVLLAPAAPVLSRPATPPTSTAGAAGTPSFPASPPPAQAQIRPAPAAKVQAEPAAPKASPAAAASSGQKVAVKAGDTAGKIAAQNKPSSISLDQMLVALLRSNPDAFIGGNINRIKSGVVLDIPSAEEASTVPAGEATKTIVAQAKDFNDFRQKLASGVPTTQIDGATRQVGGKVQAKVDDRAPVAAVPDKLTLSKGAVQGKAVAEDKIAKDKQAKDASARVAELSKNIGDLNKLTGASPATAAGTAATAAAAAPVLGASAAKTPGLAVTAPAALPAAIAPTSTPVAVAASATATAVVGTTSLVASSTATATAGASAVASAAAAPAVATIAPATPVVVKKPVTPPPPPPEPSLIDELTNNEMVLPGLAALLALLAGFGFYRYKKRDNNATVDSSFLESRLQPDSFFGASGGQRIDTSEGGSVSGSSLVYSPSQLDAAGDVDPVAEADVYLAYGRDLQAEEILKEALRTNPTRVAIHAKLLEIYAKRRDLKGFEVVASEAYALTRGNGSEWAYICELGRDLDPTNPLYQPGAQPPNSAGMSAAQAAGGLAASAAATAAYTMTPQPGAGESSVDFDLDLDFSAGDEPATAAAIAAPALPDFSLPPVPAYSPEPTVAVRAVPQPAPAFDGLDMDFGSDKTAPFTTAVAPEPTDNGMSFTLDDPLPVTGKAAPAAAKPPAVELDSGMLEFDMGSLSLDLDTPITESPSIGNAGVAAAPTLVEGPLETKLALAVEFQELGDSDGARSLASEVLAEATGELKSKAQAFLKSLS